MDHLVEREEFLTTDEEGLKRILKKSLCNDFTLKEERRGYHLLEKHGVRIDFLAYPKEHLIRKSFDPVWFGIEVKSPAVKKEAVKNVLDLAKQAIDYTESDFDGIIPHFVVIFPSMYHFFIAQGTYGPRFESFLYYFKAFIQRMKVGTMHIKDEGDWAIRFGTQRYFSSRRGRGLVKNVGTKRHIGSV